MTAEIPATILGVSLAEVGGAVSVVCSVTSGHPQHLAPLASARHKLETSPAPES